MVWGKSNPHEGDQVPEASEIEGQAERAETVQPSEEKAQGGSHHWVSVPDRKTGRRWRLTLLSGAQLQKQHKQ